MRGGGRLALLAAALAGAAGMAGGGDMGSDGAADGTGERRYGHVVMAPDACWSVDPSAELRRDGDALVVRRTLRRDEAMVCAQVLTPLEVSGAVAAPPGVRAVRLEVVGPEGEVLERVDLF